MSRIPIALGEVQETLLIPLYGRARDAAARHPVLGDTRAAELVAALDYDFGGFGGPSLPGAVLRSAIFDGWVRGFLRAHPDGTVVEIGTGLNTRFERVDNGRVHWFDVDLPDVIELRRTLFDDGPRRTTIAGSVLETDWHAAVAASPGPYLFVAEAVLFYLPEERVRDAVAGLAASFPGETLAFDTGGALMMRNQERNGSMRAVDARMVWTCDDPRELAGWGLRLLDSRTFANPQPEVGRGWPWRYRHGLRAMAAVARGAVESYRLNLFRMPGQP